MRRRRGGPLLVLAEAPEVEPETLRLDLTRKCLPYSFASSELRFRHLHFGTSTQ